MDDDATDSESLHESVIIQSSYDHNLIKNLLRESLEREKELRRLLDEEMIKNDQLRIELEIEKKKKIVIKDNESDSDECEKAPGESSPACLDLKETFGTNSTILMQYKYDELREAYSKCVKKLCKKSKYLKRVLQEAEFERFKNVQLTNENIELNKKVEEVCHRFLHLLDRRDEEQEFFIKQIEELYWKLMDYNRQ